MNDAERILAIVESIAAARPFTADAVSRATGTKLYLAASESNDFFAIYRADDSAGGLFCEVELRVSRSTAAAQGGLVLLELAGDAGRCIDRGAVMARWGESPELLPPNPHQLAGALYYLRYALDWGAISFGFATEPRECLGAIVLDAIGAEP